MAQAAIKFVQQFSAVSVVIPRAVNLEQLNDVLATPRAPPISVQEMARIAATTAKTCDMLKSHAYRQ
jgi:aryl-alcohol dehydrogenase-like predicted oxidoreductase